MDGRNSFDNTPLAWAINWNKPDAQGAKMSNLPKWLQIPDWVQGIVTKRQNLRRSLTSFTGVLRKRFVVSGGGTELIRGRLPRDVVGLLGRWVWMTRFDRRWHVYLRRAN